MENVFKSRFTVLELWDRITTFSSTVRPFQTSSETSQRDEFMSMISRLDSILQDENYFYINPALMAVSDGDIVDQEPARAARWTLSALYTAIGTNPETFLEQKKFLLTRECYPSFLDAMFQITDLLQFYTAPIWVAAEGVYKFQITKIR